MTEPTTAKAEVHVGTIFAETLGHDLMAALLGELRTMPDHWMRMNEENQQKAIARLRDKVKTMVHETAGILMRGEFPAVAATLDAITIKDGVKITLAMDASQQGRHALYDTAGKKVLVVLADSERWLERMDEIKAKADQLQLFDEDYDPSVDQPGYRRDQDRVAPAGLSWAELKERMKNREITKEEAEKQFGGPLPEKEPVSELIDISSLSDTLKRYRYLAHGDSQVERMRGDGAFEAAALRDIQRADVVRLGGEGGETYTAVHASLKSGDAGEYSITLEELKPLAFGSTAEAQSAAADERSELQILLEKLWAVRVTLSLGTLQTFTPQQLAVTSEWVNAYAADPEHCKIARPFFLPMPDAGAGDDDQQQAAEG